MGRKFIQGGNITGSTRRNRGHPRKFIPLSDIVGEGQAPDTFAGLSQAVSAYPIPLSNIQNKPSDPIFQLQPLLKIAEASIDSLVDVAAGHPYIHCTTNDGGILWVTPPFAVEMTHDVEKYLANLGTYIEPETEMGRATLVTIATFDNNLTIRKKRNVAYLALKEKRKYGYIPDDIRPQYGPNVPDFIKALTTRKDVSELMELSERNDFVHVTIDGNVANVAVDEYDAVAVHRTDNFTIAYLINQGYRQQVGRVDPIGQGPHFLGRADPDKRKADKEVFFTLGLLDPNLRVLNREGIAYLCANQRTAKELMTK